MLFSLHTEIIDTKSVDFLTLFIGDGTDTIENLGYSVYKNTTIAWLDSMIGNNRVVS